MGNKIDKKLKHLMSNVNKSKLSLEIFLNEKIFNCEDSISGIYICTYKKDKRYVYIGKTKNFVHRWNEHERDLINSTHCGNFQTFYTNNNCNLDDFEWQILDYLPNDQQILDAQEKYRIQQYNKDGYHILLNSIKYGG